MNISEKILCAALFAGAFIFTSCTVPVAKKPIEPVAFTAVSFKENAPLFPENASAEPSFRINISFDAAEKSFGSDDFSWLNKITTAKVFGEKYATGTVAGTVEKFVDDEIRDYRREWSALFKEIGETPSANNLLTLSARRERIFEAGILVYSIERYEYRGGAHGLGTKYFLNVDLKSGKVLALKDILREDFAFPLAELLIEQAMEIESVKTREELAVRYTPGVTENFELCPDGILFYYNPCEIAAYVRGAIRLKISYEKLRSLLRDDFQLGSSL